MNCKGLLAAAAVAASTLPVQGEELSLAYFMGPRHPMNAAVFTPFAERLAELSGGELTVEMFPGGALNSVPPQQYSILLDGVADIVFALPGYTGDVFPMTNVVTLPDVCDSALDCTEALLRARDLIEQEYQARVLAVWANSPPILITRDTPVRTMEDIEGLLVRVTAIQDAPFAEAIGASAVTQPVSVINQNLTNGVIDGISIGASAIGSFNLHEPGNYLTTYFPGSGSAFVLLMNQEVYDGLSDEERAWVDEAANDELSLSGGRAFDAAAARGIEIAREAGVEIIDLTDEERARWQDAYATALEEARAEVVGDTTVGAVMDRMMGQ
ncbi:MAG: TRAP transporter substrate-binding protein [Alterinioella nitratireducens]|uniref:TRAP transporter substrate-binding protein n=1 Tax=Alterinioella nitratireducens TaxID=2735915 RepID=UPI0040593F72